MVLKSTEPFLASGKGGPHQYFKQERNLMCYSWLDDGGSREKVPG